jgi:cell cycle sensor histidine kinase DivJ
LREVKEKWASRSAVLSRASLRLLRAVADGMAHPSVLADGRRAAAHAAFIGTRVLRGLIAVALLPVLIALEGRLDGLELALFLGLIAPMGAALLASRSGRLDAARLVSALSLVIAVTAAAFLSGGVFSPAVAWLVLAPVEALEHPSRREAVIISLAAILGAVALAISASCGWTPAPAPSSSVIAPALVVTALVFAAMRVLKASDQAVTAQLALRRLRESNRLVLENLGDLFTRHDETGACTFASSAARTLLGVAPSELIGQGLFQRVHVADRPAFLRAITDAGARREPANVTVRLRDETIIAELSPGPRRDLAESRFIWADLRAHPAICEHPSEERIEVVAVMRDVTEQKAREEELECARIGAEEADRSKSRFLATVSHELRTPLNAVIGFSEMLANPDLTPKDPARIREYARIIHASGAHLLDMVNSFLDASRIESGRFELKVERFDLAELVRSACAIVDVKSAESGVRLSTVAPMEGVTFEGDQRACRQIVINLVSNAVKFTPRGGRVKVQLRRVGSLIELTVDDTGIGIAASDLARLGDPFFQAKSSYDRPYEGTGLGLSVVRGLVGLHGGSLQIESTPGAGTCVAVRLPVERPEEAPSALSIPRIDARPRPSAAQAVA